MNGLSSVSRAICIEHTYKMVQVLTQQFQRFDSTKFPQTQLQHIGTALAALISARAISRDVRERTKLLESLHVLADLTRALSPRYTAAETMSDVVDNLLKEPGWTFKQTAGMDQDLLKDFSQDISHQNHDSLNDSSSSTNHAQEGTSPSKLPDEFNFTLESDHGMGTMSGFGEVQRRQQISGALAPVSADSSQQMDAHGELDPMSDAPLASWDFATLDANCGPGDSFDPRQYINTNMQFDSML
jgi:hypothetical protein